MDSGPRGDMGETMKVTQFRITEFTSEIAECPECTEQLIEAVASAGGVQEAELHDGESLRVSYDPEMISVHEIERKARALGMEIAADLDEVTYTAERLCCADCAAH